MDSNALDELRSLATEHSVAFVAGMTIKEPDGPMPPFSSANLVDSSGCSLLCRKQGDDGTGNYTSYKGIPDASNPIKYGNSPIAAMICMDCGDPQIFRPIEAALSQAQGHKIVCIPACMNSVYGDHAIAGSWPNHCVVLANSYPHGYRSFISKDGAIIRRDNREIENTIALYAI